MTGTRVPARGARLVELHARQIERAAADERQRADELARARTDLAAAFALHGAEATGRFLLEGWEPRALLVSWTPQTPAQRSLRSAVTALGRAMHAATPAAREVALEDVRDWIADANAGGAR